MNLRARVYSTQVFDPKKWLSCFKINSSEEAASFQLILEKFRNLRSAHQSYVCQALPRGAIRESLTLHAMLVEKQEPARIFQKFASSANLKLLSDLVETCLFHMLRIGNLNAVVSLVHILLQSDVKHYKLSNQFWSILSSKAGALSHHAAASQVYHEIINPYVGLVDGDQVSDENEHIPFLILPTAIESLAIVFAQNGNYVAVEGLRRYFKSFYSNFGHRDVYQTLYIAKVESLAKAGLFSEALDAFMALAVKYRGYLNHRDPKDTSHSLKYASYKNYKKRQKIIAQNLSIESGKDVEFGGPIKLFLPDVRFNDYSIKNGMYWAILDGALIVEDLPEFKYLLCETIRGMILHAESVVDRLLGFISNNHPAMSKFVVACLCDLGYCLEAIAIADKMIGLYPKIRDDTLISFKDVSHIFRALELHIRAQKPCIDLEDHKMVMECYNLCDRLGRNGSVPYPCFRSFLNCYFISPYANMTEITSIIESWKSNEKMYITIDKDAYQEALHLGISTLRLSKFIYPRL